MARIHLSGLILACVLVAQPAAAQLQVGAAKVDVTPLKFPVLVNGSMTSRTANQVKTRLHARAIVVADGKEKIAIVVVDSCMMPRPLLDDAKKRASQRCGISPDRILISATHTHSAPSSLSCLGTEADPSYVPFLREKLADAVAMAAEKCRDAKVGFGSVNVPELTALRRWVRRPDRLGVDPFGNPTVRANMHAARNWDDVTGQTGPEDPQLGVIMFQGLDGKPIAVLANYSMHYFGDQALSADYFGLFCDYLEAKMGGEEAGMVAAMSHGCSGDIWRRDYAVPADQRPEPKINEYARQLGDLAIKACETATFSSDQTLAMAEERMQLKYRVPDVQLLEWSKRIVDEMGDRLPKTRTEVYAKEQLILHERQSTEVVVQGLRLGSILIATTPNETYALTGLKIKLQSPFPQSMVIELANGGDGYIPPPEQHALGISAASALRPSPAFGRC